MFKGKNATTVLKEESKQRNHGPILSAAAATQRRVLRQGRQI
jgi:hypothetical protein